MGSSTSRRARPPNLARSELNTVLPPPEIGEQGLLKEHFQLPPLPELVTKVLQRIRSGDATAQEIADILSADVGLVAQILKIVNSAYYGLPRQITEAKHAVAYLGLAEIERAALTATVMKDLAPREQEQHRIFWYHSFYTALAAKQMQRRYAPAVDVEELHTAVLLHDIGKLVYLKFFPEHYSELLRHCRANGQLLVEAERALDYPSHQTLGDLLCEHWNLPDTVRQACLHHELDDLRKLDMDEPGAEQTRLVCLANLLSNLATGELSPETKHEIRAVTTESVGGSDQDFLLLMGEIYELKSEVESFLLQL